MLRFSIASFIVLVVTAIGVSVKGDEGETKSNLRKVPFSPKSDLTLIRNENAPPLSMQLGVITMDQEAAIALQQILASSTELAQYVDQWYNDESVGTQHQQYLVLLQDPMDHLVASWNRHYNAYFRNGVKSSTFSLQTDFFKCFRDLEEFAYVGLSNTKVPNDCQKLARQVAQGSIHEAFFGEFHFNHAYHFQTAVIDAQKMVYVVRQEDEHIRTDIHRIHGMITGQERPQSQLKFPTLPSPVLNLSSEAMTNLCRILCNDIQVYKHIIAQSMNLGDYVYEQTQVHLAQSCPEEALIEGDDICPWHGFAVTELESIDSTASQSDSENVQRNNTVMTGANVFHPAPETPGGHLFLHREDGSVTRVQRFLQDKV